MTLQTSQTESNQKNGYSLEKKIDLITKSLSRAYYKNILIKLQEYLIPIVYLEYHNFDI